MRLTAATDHTLLLRWRTRGDPAAFAVLVERHAAMVHSVSMRVIGNRALAQEIAQDSFLRLTQLDRFDGESVGGWLHRVTTNRAFDIAKAEARRRTREAEYEASRHPTAPDSESAALLDEIDAAIAALPEEVREPLVLHYLEGHTHREISRALNVSRATVARRIKTGLDELRSYFNTRVVATAAGIVAALESARAYAAPEALIASLRKLALAPPAHAPSPTPVRWLPPPYAVITGTVVLITAAILTFSALRTTPAPETAVQAAAAQSIVPQTPETVPLPEPIPAATEPTVPPTTAGAAPALAIHGDIRDVGGNPVPGARIVLFHNANDWGLNDRVIEETKSGENGDFTLSSAPIYLQDHATTEDLDVYTVFATHPDHALGWANLRRGAEYEPIAIALLKPQTGSVLVVDHADNTPIAGARVWPYSLGMPDDPIPNYRDRVFVHSDPGILSATTTGDGIAFLTNLPSSELAFRVTKPGYAFAYVFAEGGTARLTRGARLTGHIADEAGNPVAGAIVTLDAFKWMSLHIKMLSDEHGNFAFNDLPADGWDMSAWKQGVTGDGRYRVLVSSERAWIAGDFIQLSPGEHKHLELKAQSGTRVRVRCRVVTEISRQPVPGAGVEWFQHLADDTNPKAYADERGEVAFTVPAGEVAFIVRTPPEGTYWNRDVLKAWLDDFSSLVQTFSVHGPETIVTLTSPEPGGRLVPIQGRVAVPPGIAASDIVVCASSQEGLTLPGRYRDAFFASTSLDDRGQYSFEGAPENVRIHVYASTRDDRYAGVVTATVGPGPNPAPIATVRLITTVSLDYAIEGDPIEKTLTRTLTVRLEVNGENLRCGAPDRDVKADAAGIFHIPNILPRQTYRLVDFESLKEEEEKDHIDSVQVLAP